MGDAASPIPDPLIEAIATRLRVLGEPMRIRLLHHLRHGAASVSELQRATDASQQNVSKHLATLLEAGMVARTKHGRSAHYSVIDESVFELYEQARRVLSRQLAELERSLHRT